MGQPTQVYMVHGHIMDLPTQVYMVHSHIVHYEPAYTGIYGSWSYCPLWAYLHRYIWFIVILSIMGQPTHVYMVHGHIMDLPTQVYMVHGHIVYYGPAYTGIYGS